MQNRKRECTQRAGPSRECSLSLSFFLSFLFFPSTKPEKKKKVFFFFHLLPHGDRVERVVDYGPRQRDQKRQCAPEDGDEGQDGRDAGELRVGERGRGVGVEAVSVFVVVFSARATTAPAVGP